jgi:SnoaL-like polyketide cyclase
LLRGGTRPGRSGSSGGSQVAFPLVEVDCLADRSHGSRRVSVCPKNLGHLHQEVRAELISEGDRVFCRSTMTGTHDGEYKGIPPTGRHISAESAEVYRIVDGKFAGYWCLTNVAGLMRQLTEEPVAAASAGGGS